MKCTAQPPKCPWGRKLCAGIKHYGRAAQIPHRQMLSKSTEVTLSCACEPVDTQTMTDIQGTSSNTPLLSKSCLAMISWSSASDKVLPCIHNQGSRCERASKSHIVWAGALVVWALADWLLCEGAAGQNETSKATSTRTSSPCTRMRLGALQDPAPCHGSCRTPGRSLEWPQAPEQ